MGGKKGAVGMREGEEGKKRHLPSRPHLCPPSEDKDCGECLFCTSSCVGSRVVCSRAGRLDQPGACCD